MRVSFIQPSSELLHEKAKHAAWLYAIMVRKAHMCPVPHGYGDGSYECIGWRCDKALKLDAAAEAAYATTDVDVRCGALWPMLPCRYKLADGRVLSRGESGSVTRRALQRLPACVPVITCHVRR